jgi:hypothetical protein
VTAGRTPAALVWNGLVAEPPRPAPDPADGESDPEVIETARGDAHDPLRTTTGAPGERTSRARSPGRPLYMPIEW